ncbi:hypothetical protein I6F26_11695 [Ensifer sp. IC3342]|nr:hypothetical protein [Ensifer sp. BRP08]MCA1447239.1 hypothetical protein [Ensifer sp. IC3342]
MRVAQSAPWFSDIHEDKARCVHKLGRDALLNTVRGREEAIHVILGWVKTDVEIAVARGDLVAIGNPEHVVLRHEMVIPRGEE